MIVEAIVDGSIDAYATVEIVEEYMGIIEDMVEKKQGKLNQSIFAPLFSSLKIIEAGSGIQVCRDPDLIGFNIYHLMPDVHIIIIKVNIFFMQCTQFA